MAEIHWQNAVSGDFNAGANWVGGVAPGPTDDAILDASGPVYTVTDSASGQQTVGIVQTGANATVDIGSLLLADGTGGGINAGTIEGNTLTTGGDVDNSGQIAVSSFNIENSVTLSGGGTISFTDLSSLTTTATLDNVDETLVGSGTFFIEAEGGNPAGSLTLANEAGGVIDFDNGLPLDAGNFIVSAGSSNAGLIEATGNSALDLDTIANTGTILAHNSEIIASGTSNTGLLEAKGANGTLVLNGFNNPNDLSDGGEILADGGVVVVDGTIRDTTIETENGGAVDNDLGGGGVYIDDTFVGNFPADGSATLEGATDNQGVIATSTAWTLSASDITLTGGGKVTVASGTTIFGGFLDNVDNKIVGAGDIGGGSLALTNEAAGTIKATGVMTLDAGPITIANAGVIEAVGASGVLTIASAVTNTGALEVGQGGSLTASAAVSGGEAVVAGGVLDFASTFTGDATFEGAGTLGLAQSQAYAGSISGLTGGDQLDLGDIAFVGANEATFVGTASGGVLTVTDGTHTTNLNLVGDYMGVSFTSASDGHGGVTVAAAPVHWLDAVSGDFNTAANWSSGAVPQSADNVILGATGGAYTVTDSASSQTVGSLQTAANATLVAENLVLTDGTGGGLNAGTINARGLLTLDGDVDNSGQIIGQDIEIDNSITLSGGGTITATDVLFTNMVTLDNVNQTLVVADAIDPEGPVASLVLTNEAAGVIDFDVGKIGNLNASGSNAGLIEGTNGGGVHLFYIDNTGTILADSGQIETFGITNTGLLEAEGFGSQLLLDGQGVTADTSDGGEILANGGPVFLDDVTIANTTIENENGGLVDCSLGSDVLLNDTIIGVLSANGSVALGAIDNQGVIAATTASTLANSGAVLTGGGKVTVASGTTVFSQSTVDNVDNKIVGAGDIGGGKLTLTNEAAGIIKATGAMTLDAGSNTIANAGTIGAIGAAAVLTIASAIANTGKLKVSQGGSLTANGAVSGGAAVIAGGTLDFAATFTGDVDFTGVGTLELSHARNYSGTITGFSSSGANTIDLGNIAFVNAGEATFVGNAIGGVLTATDGTHTAHLNLVGDYTGSTFTAASDGHGGVTITDPPKPAAFTAAMASLGAAAGSGTATAPHEAARPAPMIAVRAPS